MATTLIHNINTLVQVREGHEVSRGASMSQLPCLSQAYLIIENDLIQSYGSIADLPELYHFDQVIDAHQAYVLPAWCDSHTHLVFAESRENEFVQKLKGATYSEIAAQGGGILNSAKKIAEISEEQLYDLSLTRLNEAAALGTGAIEIKSGYGLSMEGELKMLRVIKKLKTHSNLIIRSTFLGAHAYPAIFKQNHQAYLDLLVDQLLPVIAEEGLADYIDVFCEQGFFSLEESRYVLEAGLRYGLRPKIHANQLSISGGVQLGTSLNAVSVDHLESMDDEAIYDLAQSKTIGTLLPTAAFFLRLPFAPARSMIDQGCGIALASDFNPGSSPTFNMNLVISMACIGMKMLPEEAIQASTLNGACAMGVDHLCGSITRGKKANLIITRPIPSLAYLPYALGMNLIDQVIINGKVIG